MGNGKMTLPGGTMSVALIITYPPATGNRTTRSTKAGSHYTLPQIVKYRLSVRCDIYRQMEAVRQEVGYIPLGTPLKVEAEFVLPDKRKRDVDNAWKVVADAITRAGLWTDDSLIHHLVLTKRVSPDGHGYVALRVEVLP